MELFNFIDKVSTYESDKSFLAKIDSNIKTKESLFENLYSKMQFPNYFGFNWDALFDCLRDFHWIEEKKIVLIHTEVPQINETDLKTYLNILHEAIQDWKEDDTHVLEVVFPKADESKLKSLMNLGF